MDLTSLTFPDDSFDAVLCSHVLEHIPDDDAALRELARVTRPGGLIVLQHPVHQDHDTYEDWTITSPEGRLAHFGQADHVRIYGSNDFSTRLQAAGLHFEQLRTADIATEQQVRENGLAEPNWPVLVGSDLFLCRQA